MDGNRRWAIKRGWQAWLGHREGVNAAKRVVHFCLDKKIPYVSLYTFSTENFKRSHEEKEFLFSILAQEVIKELPYLKEKGIRVRFMGDWLLYPPSVKDLCAQVEHVTAPFNTLQINFLFCYGAQQEIVSGVKHIIRLVQEGKVTEQDLTEETFNNYLWTAGLPAPEIIIRTSGEQRLSNFLLYQAAYSQLYFLDCLWPDLALTDLEKVLILFASCRKNGGA